MCEGEFESLKAIHAVSPAFVPEPYAWGKYTQEEPETYFLLAEFRDVGKQVRASRFEVFRYGISPHQLIFCCPLFPSGCSEEFRLPIILNEAIRYPSPVTVSRLIANQPASPIKLAAGLANLHKESVSPTGKFGFHMATCHAKIAQAVDTWEDSWCALYTRHLGHVMNLAKPILRWPEFDIVCKLTLEKVVPRLLLPLQSEGRVLKPCLIHGDCWDGK